MIFEFLKNKIGECALCGSADDLTGEHKIKASILKQEFPNRKMSFYNPNNTGRPKLAQSPKSKVLQFNSKICRFCNSSRTQAGDEAFNHLHHEMKILYTTGQELTNNKNRPNYSASPKDDINVFRYFAKILCCFMAEVDGPRPKSVSAFAIGESLHNPVHLNISVDKTHQDRLIALSTDGYASHGGLIVRFDENKKYVTAIESSLSIGGISYNFWIQPNRIAALELHILHNSFVRNAYLKIEE